MLKPEELAAWYERMNLPQQARSVVDQVRSSEPARHVRGGHSNVSGRYPSRKMGVTIQFESHRVELAVVYELEHNADVLEYWDQPNSIKLDYESAHGRHLGVLHTPDYFVIRRTEAGWEECKTEEDLRRLAERNANRYFHDDKGGWRCPPGEAYAHDLGLYYRVRSSRDINWVFQRIFSFWKTICAQTVRVRPPLFARTSSLSYRLAPALRCPTYLRPAKKLPTATLSIG